MGESDAIRFYFSFRSPYAWIAAERLEPELGGLGVPIERVPVFPTARLFPNDPTVIPDKVAYLVQDVRRLARANGLTLGFPAAVEVDWASAHAAFFGAREQGAEQAFMVALFRKRFGEGLDVGEDEVIRAAASSVGLEPGAILEAAHSEKLRAEAAAGWARAVERDHIFGVPSFVYAGKLYWGQDRMAFVRSAVKRKSGLAATESRAN